MTPFDPNWPHGHQLRDGRKAELRGRINDKWLAVITEPDGHQWQHEWYNGGVLHPGVPSHKNDIINAPGPKRTWEVVAVEWPGGGVAFHHAHVPIGSSGKIIGRYTLPEGEGMEEKNV